MRPRPLAVVTGASTGIGLEFYDLIRRLARPVDVLIANARRNRQMSAPERGAAQ
ncbi:MAG: hypothetical protein ACR652_09340 [Methylocystis sp.]|uniref:hypothetical protein n=1 Tax=Methylocystis sp. TaxID=1911079 RepID=UPI003DA6022B